MGCLLEILVLPFEFIIETIVGGWYDLMTWILPDNSGGKIFRFFVKCLIAIECCVLGLILIIGLIAAIPQDVTIFDLRKLIFTPILISLIQIFAEAVVHFVIKKFDKLN